MSQTQKKEEGTDIQVDKTEKLYSSLEYTVTKSIIRDPGSS